MYHYGLLCLGTYLGHGTIYSSNARPSTNYNTIPCPGTLYDTLFFGRLPIVTLSFGYSTRCNIILARHHCNNIAVTTNDAKGYTVVYDNICGTKCNNDSSYPGNGGTLVVTVLLLWSYPGYDTKCVSRFFVNQSSFCPLCVWKIHWYGMTQLIWNIF